MEPEVTGRAKRGLVSATEGGKRRGVAFHDRIGLAAANTEIRLRVVGGNGRPHGKIARQDRTIETVCGTARAAKLAKKGEK
jgi:hypothetical protein